MFCDERYEKGKISLHNSHLCMDDADKHGFMQKQWERERAVRTQKDD